jgi:hypothetical protein
MPLDQLHRNATPKQGKAFWGAEVTTSISEADAKLIGE